MPLLRQRQKLSLRAENRHGQILALFDIGTVAGFRQDHAQSLSGS